MRALSIKPLGPRRFFCQIRLATGPIPTDFSVVPPRSAKPTGPKSRQELNDLLRGRQKFDCYSNFLLAYVTRITYSQGTIENCALRSFGLRFGFSPAGPRVHAAP